MSDNIEKVEFIDETPKELPASEIKPEAAATEPAKEEEGGAEGGGAKTETIEAEKEKGLFDKFKEWVKKQGGGREMPEELKRKIRIKIEKFGGSIAQAEMGAYNVLGLNAPLMQDAEILEDYNETKEDFELILKYRTNIESEWGDLINAGIDITDHIGERLMRLFSKGRKEGQQKQKQQDEAQYGDEYMNPDGSLTPKGWSAIKG